MRQPAAGEEGEIDGRPEARGAETGVSNHRNPWTCRSANIHIACNLSVHEETNFVREETALEETGEGPPRKGVHMSVVITALASPRLPLVHSYIFHDVNT